MATASRRILGYGRWALIGLFAVTLGLVVKNLVQTELALPQHRAAAAEAVGFESHSERMYVQTRDSLGFRLAERHNLITAMATDSARGEAGALQALRSDRVALLDEEIADWSERMSLVLAYRQAQTGLSGFRLLSWTSIALLTLVLLVLWQGPRVAARFRG